MIEVSLNILWASELKKPLQKPLIFSTVKAQLLKSHVIQMFLKQIKSHKKKKSKANWRYE